MSATEKYHEMKARYEVLIEKPDLSDAESKELQRLMVRVPRMQITVFVGEVLCSMRKLDMSINDWNNAKGHIDGALQMLPISKEEP